MNPEIVGYRYSRTELSVLMHLMGIPSLPGFTPDTVDETTYNAAVTSLVNANLAARGDGKIFVDRITALILSAMHRQRGSLCLESSNRKAVLIRSDIMYVLAEYPKQGTCILTPLQSAEDVSEPAQNALKRISFPALITLNPADGSTRREQAATEKEAWPILTALFDELCAKAEPPTER